MISIVTGGTDLDSNSQPWKTFQTSIDGLGAMITSIVPSVISEIQHHYVALLQATEQSRQHSAQATIPVSVVPTSHASTQTKENSIPTSDSLGNIFCALPAFS